MCCVLKIYCVHNNISFKILLKGHIYGMNVTDEVVKLRKGLLLRIKGCLKYRRGVCVQITFLRSISSYYSKKYWRNWQHECRAISFVSQWLHSALNSVNHLHCTKEICRQSKGFDEYLFFCLCVIDCAIRY